MTVKEVKIAMTPAEEKTISRLQTRRKRLQKKMTGGELPEIKQESDEQIEAPIQTAPVQTAPIQTAPVQAAPVQTTPVQSAGASVRIQATKRGSGIQKPQTVQGTSKILPTKRHMTVKRKPVMKFGGAIPTGTAPITGTATGNTNLSSSGIPTGPAGPVVPAPAPSPITGTATGNTNLSSSGIPTGPAGPVVPVPAPSPITGTVTGNTNLSSSGIPTGPAGPVVPAPAPSTITGTVTVNTNLSSSGIPTGPAQMGAGKRKTRRFKERRMSITIKNAEQTRKQKKSIRRQVKQMDIKDIRKILLSKGMISAKSNPPEKMLRSMMKEYLLLQAN